MLILVIGVACLVTHTVLYAFHVLRPVKIEIQ